MMNVCAHSLIGDPGYPGYPGQIGPTGKRGKNGVYNYMHMYIAHYGIHFSY